MAATISENACLTKVCLSHIQLGTPQEPQKCYRVKCVIPTDTRPELPHLAKYDSSPQGETDLRLYFSDLWELKK